MDFIGLRLIAIITLGIYFLNSYSYELHSKATNHT